jgi:RNA polymerase sigma-70 factor (ECF subfamily)
MTDDVRNQFEHLVGELRPKLHRYCARMTGSAVDGEDIVQDALIKALAVARPATDGSHPVHLRPICL